MNNSQLTKTLIEALRSSEDSKTTGYDTSATVKRIENGVAWVHIPGGVDETPAKLTINASVGDVVQVRVSGGRAFLVGNGSAPPTDDTTALNATKTANKAHRTALQASEEATEAWNYAGTAAEAAVSAKTSADSAATAASNAWDHAEEARLSAISANNSANNALVQLSVVEDVAGTLRWISEHGSFVPTTDTRVIEGSVYFVYENGDYIPIANPDPSANPSQEGWYVLDVTESQAKYIMAHLAVTSAGLWVLPVDQLAEHPLVDSNGNQLVDSNDNPLVDFSADPQHASGYKVLLSGTGMSVFNDEGAVVANYGTTTTIGSEMGKHVYIDTDSVDIKDGGTVLARFNSGGVYFYKLINGVQRPIARFTSGLQDRSLLFIPSPNNSSAEPYGIGSTLDSFAVENITSSSYAEEWTGIYKARYSANGIYYNDSSFGVGTILTGYYSSDSDSATSSVWTTVDQLGLTEGTWIISFGASFDQNSNGMRYVVLNTSTAAEQIATRQDLRFSPANGGQSSLQGTRIVKLTSDTDYYLHVYQNSGSSLTVYPFIRAIKIV